MTNIYILDKFRRIGRIILILLILIIFAVSLYFNYLYFKGYLQNKKLSALQNKSEVIIKKNIVVGKVISIDKSSVVVNDVDDNSKKTVGLNKETKYSKTWINPSNYQSETIDATLEYLKNGMTVNVYLADNSTENNLLAKEVNAVVQNVFWGVIKSIDQNNIKISQDVPSADLVKKTSEIKLMDIKITSETKYFKMLSQIKPNEQNSSNTDQVSLKPDLAEINFTEIKIDQNVAIVTDDIYKDNTPEALKIIIDATK